MSADWIRAFCSVKDHKSLGNVIKEYIRINFHPVSVRYHNWLDYNLMP